MLPVERKEATQNSMICSIDSNVKGEKDNVNIAGNCQVPNEVLLQIMRAKGEQDNVNTAGNRRVPNEVLLQIIRAYSNFF